MRINVGCGRTPTPGWRNFDNSLSLRLARLPALPKVLHRLRLIGAEQFKFIEFAQGSALEFANAGDRLPVDDASADVVYSAHMLEHLPRPAAGRFLAEAFRVLKKGGILRLAVPDLRRLTSQYLETGDADGFIQSMLVCPPAMESVASRLLSVFLGPRDQHLWMYDGPSLSRLLKEHGFRNVEILPPGSTRIAEPGDLDLRERESESVYVEAERPL
jgi:predicted SAM-dependent methyltransferase